MSGTNPDLCVYGDGNHAVAVFDEGPVCYSCTWRHVEHQEKGEVCAICNPDGKKYEFRYDTGHLERVEVVS